MWSLLGTCLLSGNRFLTATRTGTLRPRGSLAPLSKPTLSAYLYIGTERVGLESGAKAPRGLRVPVRVPVKNLPRDNRQVPSVE